MFPHSTLPNGAALAQPAVLPAWNGPGAESFRLLAHRLGLGNPSQRERLTVGLTSATAKEGVSSVAAGLAAAAASATAREVLMIDAQFPARLQPVLRGLSEVCHEGERLENVLQATPMANVLWLPRGNVRPGVLPVAGLTSQWRPRFEIIVVDLPPPDAWHDVLPLATALDGIVLVVEAERVGRSLARRTQRQLESFNIPLLGAVVNKQKHYVPRWLERWF